MTPSHGFAVLGVEDSTIALCDPANAKTLPHTLEELPGTSQVVLSASPL